MKDKISVIVPIYNMENYLKRCVESILNQTYTNLEIILVDDGSTDSSLEICRYFENKDKRVRVYTKENSGLSASRNFGVERATGVYIGFVDSDDYIEAEMYEKLYNLIIDFQAEVAECNLKICYPSNTELYTKEKYTLVLDREEYFKEYLTMSKIFGSVCTRLIKKELAKSIFFPVGKIYEDTFFSFDLIKKAEKYVITDGPYYNYFMRNESITNSHFKESMLDLIEIVDEIFIYVQEFLPHLIQESECRQMYAYLSLFNSILQDDSLNHREYFEKYYKYFSQNWKKLLCNPYITLPRKFCVCMICLNVNLYKIILNKYIYSKNR
jgi:hypothetical protein